MSLSEYIKDLKDNEKEQVYAMFAGFESTSEETLLDIICSSSNKDTIDKAMKHNNFSISAWNNLLSRKDFIGITREELLDSAYKKTQKSAELKECFDIYMGIVSSPITAFERLKEILAFILIKMSGYRQKLKEVKDNGEYTTIEFSNLIKQAAYILMLISVHPNCNLDLSNKVFELLKGIDKKSIVEHSNGYSMKSYFQAIQTFFYEKNGYHKEYEAVGYKSRFPNADLLKFNNLPCMANIMILDCLERCKLFEEKDIVLTEEQKKSSLLTDYEKKIILDFVFDDKTTDEMIKKVLLERFDDFLVSKAGTNEQVLNSRFVSLLLSIVSDKRFEEKNISLALLKKIVLSCNNVEVIMKCLQKDDTGELISLVLSNGVKISVNDISKLSKGAIINIASTTNDSVFFYQILTFSPYAKDCIEIIWNRRNEFKDKEDKDKFYAGMLLCPFSTKEMLLESLNNYSKGNGAYTSRASCIILNDNMDYDVYKTLILKLEQNQVGLTLYDYERDEIEVDDFSSKCQIPDNYEEIIYKCEMLFKYVEAVATGSINEDTVVKFIAHRFGEKYLRAYYKLLDFKQQSQTLEQKQQHPHK